MSPLGADRGMSNIPEKKGEKKKHSHHFHFPLQSEKTEQKMCGRFEIHQEDIEISDKSVSKF